MKQYRHVILANHGSLDHPLANRPLFELAARLEAKLGSCLVTPAFLNGQPAITSVLDDLPAGETLIVPIMTSEGYYFKKLPELLQQNDRFDEFHIEWTPVVGRHPGIVGLLLDRLDDLMQKHFLAPEETTVLVVGHGTRRNPDSGKTTLRLADELLDRWQRRHFDKRWATPIVQAVFLDQDPLLVEAVPRVETRHQIALPFLVSYGPHMTEDIPQAFGLPEGVESGFPRWRKLDGAQTQPAGICIVDGPLVSHRSLDPLILDLMEGVYA